MGFELNIKLGRSNKEQSRSLPNTITPESGTDKQPIEITSTGIRQQPVVVKTPAQAMRLSTAFRCTDILSGTIASLPFSIKRKQAAGNYEVDKENELHYLLTKKSNRRMNSYDTMCNAIIQMVNRGNAYIYIRRSFGDISELVLCSNDSVTYDVIRDVYTICDPINRIYGTFG